MARRALLLSLLLTFSWATNLLGQTISYVGEVSLPSDHSFVLPVNGRNAGQTGTWVLTVSSLYRWDEAANALQTIIPQFPSGLKINTTTYGAYGNRSDESFSRLRVIGVRNTLYSISTDIPSWDFGAAAISVPWNPPSMLSYVNDSTVALSTSRNPDRFFSINLSTGIGTDMGIGQVTNVGGAAVGPDGLLYVLDNPDGTYRIQSFDLSAGLSDEDRLKSAFFISASLPSGYEGMAINSHGHLFLADGLGGGTAYDLAGNHLGDFSFTDGGTLDGNGASYLNVDDAGNIFVYTPGTGLHHYYDTSYSAIPEPALFPVTLGAVTFALAARRRGRRTSKGRLNT